ncbi:MAG: hypothetical protein JSR21_21390 [Proteobacteria bacterium]|nr:hypothetical protein [Pseudomonadota bacterium]
MLTAAVLLSVVCVWFALLPKQDRRRREALPALRGLCEICTELAYAVNAPTGRAVEALLPSLDRLFGVGTGAREAVAASAMMLGVARPSRRPPAAGVAARPERFAAAGSRVEDAGAAPWGWFERSAVSHPVLLRA